MGAGPTREPLSRPSHNLCRRRRRRAGLSVEAFRREYEAPNRPVVLTDVMADWPAMRKWRRQYLRQQLGDDADVIVGGWLWAGRLRAQRVDDGNSLWLARAGQLASRSPIAVTAQLFMALTLLQHLPKKHDGVCCNQRSPAQGVAVALACMQVHATGRLHHHRPKAGGATRCWCALPARMRHNLPATPAPAVPPPPGPCRPSPAPVNPALPCMAGNLPMPLSTYLAYCDANADEMPLYLFDKHIIAAPPPPPPPPAATRLGPPGGGTAGAGAAAAAAAAAPEGAGSAGSGGSGAGEVPGAGLAGLAGDFSVPPHFSEDLFGVLGEESRPDYRWVGLGLGGV